MPASTNADGLRGTVYNVDYFSGAQVACYIGDVFVDEITSLNYGVSNERTPLYGYADQYFRDVSKGRVIVQGTFTINFKEAGYMFLILERYQRLLNGKSTRLNPFLGSADVNSRNIEQVINGEVSTFQRNEIIQAIAEAQANTAKIPDTAERFSDKEQELTTINRIDAARGLGGFASSARSTGGIGLAENIFEVFEDAIWRKPPEDLDNDHRRADEPSLNPFDIYVAFGDFAGDNRANHTIQKITGVHIVGSSKQIVIDGQPIQEAYQFIARNII